MSSSTATPTDRPTGADRRGPAVTFTLDVEDHRPNAEAELRYPHLTRQVLGFLAERNIRGTFFVVGAVAQDQPDLVREIAAAGHEVGLHAWRHVPLTTRTPEQFRDETRRGADLLASLTGTPVAGFRAPTYSLTPKVPWVPDVLSELGFVYSSSVLPGRNPLFSWPGAPDSPFTWPSGLVEFPGFLYGWGPVQLPVVGGVYGRVLPMWFLRRGYQAMDREALCHLYCHPYDFDPGERYYVVPDSGPLLSPLLWVGRRRWWRRVAELCANPAPPFIERVHEVSSTWEPPVIGDSQQTLGAA